MVDSYSQMYPFFDEKDYLAFNPDVASAVRAGSFQSGLDHYIQFGQFENRNATFTGTTGNDVIRGFGNYKYLYPTSYRLISSDPYDYAVVGTGTGERDTLVGSVGADHFALSAYTAPSIPNAVKFYVGQGDRDFALIRRFGFGEDSILLAGSPTDYSQEVINGNLYIYNKNPRDLMAVVEGVTEPLTVVDRPIFDDAFSNGTFTLGSVKNFDEPAYLAFNPEIRQGVIDGKFKSGFDHYLQFGQFESRLAPFVGTTGNDVIKGFGDTPHYLYGTAYEPVSAQPYDYRVIGTGAGEVDTLIGAAGLDNFALAAYGAPSVPNAVPLYVGGGNDDYALIQNFQKGVDTIELAGSLGNYTQEVVGSNLNIYINSPSKDLLATVQGVTTPLTQVQSTVFGPNAGTFFLS